MRYRLYDFIPRVAVLVAFRHILLAIRRTRVLIHCSIEIWCRSLALAADANCISYFASIVLASSAISAFLA
jgi:hypothetical protein